VANYDSVATIVAAEKIIDAAVSNFGRVDILVNCAGNFMPVPTVEMTQKTGIRLWPFTWEGISLAVGRLPNK